MIAYVQGLFWTQNNCYKWEPSFYNRREITKRIRIFSGRLFWTCSEKSPNQREDVEEFWRKVDEWKRDEMMLKFAAYLSIEVPVRLSKTHFETTALTARPTSKAKKLSFVYSKTLMWSQKQRSKVYHPERRTIITNHHLSAAWMHKTGFHEMLLKTTKWDLNYTPGDVADHMVLSLEASTWTKGYGIQSYHFCKFLTEYTILMCIVLILSDCNIATQDLWRIPVV